MDAQTFAIKFTLWSQLGSDYRVIFMAKVWAAINQAQDHPRPWNLARWVTDRLTLNYQNFMDLVHELCPLQLLEVTKKSDNLSGWLASIQHLAHILLVSFSFVTITLDRPQNKILMSRIQFLNGMLKLDWERTIMQILEFFILTTRRTLLSIMKNPLHTARRDGGITLEKIRCSMSFTVYYIG